MDRKKENLHEPFRSLEPYEMLNMCIMWVSECVLTFCEWALSQSHDQKRVEETHVTMTPDFF